MKDEKIDLLDIVYNCLDSKGLIDKEKKSLFRYCIKENIEAVFGRCEFDSDEIDVLTVKEGIVINSIFFDEPLNIYGVDTNMGKNIRGLMGKNMVFFMGNYGSSFVNQINGNEKTRVYKVDDDGFSLSTRFDGEHVKSQNDFDVILKLRPYNAKFRDTEVFELDRIKPSLELPKSKLQRLMAIVDSDSFVRIQTSDELVDNIDVCDRIFDVLKTRTEKVASQDTKSLNKNND